MRVEYPFISPDGKRVAYGDSAGELYVISMDGSAPQRIVEKNSRAANRSADGNTLVFRTDVGPSRAELELLDLQTGKCSVVPGSQGLVGGQWVSEETLVAAPEDLTKLMMFDVKTTRWSELVSGRWPEAIINWAHSPDNRYVLYTTGGTEPKAMRIRLADHKVETITSLKDLHRALGPEGNTQISVAPDGSPVFTRDIGTREIYALTVKWP
jgi:tricorn protease-like protein